MIRYFAILVAAIFKSKSRLVAENLCLRRQLVVLKRRQAQPRIRDADRRCQRRRGSFQLPMAA